MLKADRIIIYKNSSKADREKLKRNTIICFILWEEYFSIFLSTYVTMTTKFIFMTSGFYQRQIFPASLNKGFFFKNKEHSVDVRMEKVSLLKLKGET